MKLKNVNDPIHIKRVSTLEAFESLHYSWNNLLAESPTDNYFLRWEWLRAWWNVYKEENWELCILLCFKRNELIGIAPFYLSIKSWKGIFNIRRLMFLGTKERSVISEYMDIIYRDGNEEIIVHKIINFITNEELCDDMLLHKIETTSRTIKLLRKISGEVNFSHIIQDKYECPYISLPADYDDFLNSISSSMRHKIRNNQTKLGKYGDVVFRKTENVTELETDFNELIRLHQLRWESRQFTGSFSAGGRFVQFQKIVIPEIFKIGHLELWFLSVAGNNIAALYNIRYKNKIYFYQGGLDVSFDKNLTPGLLLHRHCIEESISKGLREYDFLLMGNTDSYKKRWTKNCRHVCNIYLARPGIMKIAMTVKNDLKALYHTAIKNLSYTSLS
jgi:CelD/BcsL family acetyltransferase involved in cellulose biosynthesis